MPKLSARLLAAACAAALSAVATFGSGVASADALVGKTYSDAAAAISDWEGKAVIATVTGNQVETDDCIVTSWNQSMFLDGRGKNNRGNEFLLNLNCNNALASPGHPGNSLMTPQGTQAKKDQQAAAEINGYPAVCEKNDDLAAWCEKICNRTGMCEI